MATDNPRVATYLSPENHQALQAYCKQYGIKSLSGGIDRILGEFFGTLPEDPRSTLQATSSTPDDTRERVAALEEQMAEIKAALLGELVA